MRPVTSAERETYDEMWGITSYAGNSPGEQLAPFFLDMSAARFGQVLDAGCGTGRGGLTLAAQGFQVQYLDVTDAGLDPQVPRRDFHQSALWHDLLVTIGRVDYVYCCDVLEHLPTEFTMLAAARLLEITRRGAFFSVGLESDTFGAWVGKPLHQTVRPFTWWRDHFNELGTVIEARDGLSCGLYWVER